MARSIYLLTAIAALPGMLREAFEMFFLTASGPQMLFFSVFHTMPVVALAVVVSVPMGLAWLGQSVAAALSPKYRNRIGVPLQVATFLSIGIALHAAALCGYEIWSRHPALRVIVCLLGLASTTAICIFSLKALQLASEKLGARASGSAP